MSGLDSLYPGARGALLVRVAAKSKRPRDPEWNKEALARLGDLSGRDAWVEEVQGHVDGGGNVGLVVPPQVVVIDCDTSAATAMVAKLLPDAPRQDTAKGAHFWCYAEDREFNAKVKVPLNAAVTVDLRTGGRSQVVVEPSIHETGFAYRWRTKLPPHRRLLPSIPREILDAYEHAQRKAAPAAGSGAHHGGTGAPIAEGGRNDELYRIACGLRSAQSLDVDPLYQELLEINADRCRPPLPTEEVYAIAQSACQHPPGRSPEWEQKIMTRVTHRVADQSAAPNSVETPKPQEQVPVPEKRDQLHQAETFVARWGDWFRYVEERKDWLWWDGTLWVRDTGGHRAFQRLAEMAKAAGLYALDQEGDDRKRWLRFAEQAGRHDWQRAVLGLVIHQPGMALSATDLDPDPWELNCRSGVLDLRTNELDDPDPLGLHTMQAAHFDPEAESGEWTAFLEAFAPDPETRAFLQRAAGASLVGEIVDRAVFFLTGGGANGKGTFLDALAGALGSYTMTASFRIFEHQRGGSGTNDQLARLAGKRLLLVHEAPPHGTWELETLKTYTGGDEIAAAAKYENHIRFRPKATPWLAANHKPRLPADDQAAWDRMKVIPCEARFRPKDELRDEPEAREERTDLRRMLRETPEHQAAVLAWMVAGLREHRAHGLGTCGDVKLAVAEYRDEMDEVTRWIEERCEPEPDTWTASSALYADFQTWWKDTYRRQCPSQKSFGRRLRGKHFKNDKSTGRAMWRGLALRQKP